MFVGDKEAIDRLTQLSLDIINNSRNKLVVNLRFMDVAISNLMWKAERAQLSVDGRSIYYDPVYILKLYKKDKNLLTRNYLHMVFHCVFQHFFINTIINEKYWNVACDIAVENIINELNISSVDTSFVNDQMVFISQIKKNVKFMTAEHIYHYFLDNNFSNEKIDDMQKAFYADDHKLWYMRESEENEQNSNSDSNDENADNSNSGNNSGDDEKNDNRNSDIQEQFQYSKELAQMWKNVSQKLQMDLEIFSKEWGQQAGGLTQNLKEVNREKYDYSDFLKKFAVMGEAMKVNDDEFDYIFYTYGLQLYKKMPLIEPLEYKEVKKIKEFVIAIDTSGSTSGELVQKFLQKTYNIFMQQENFFTKINVHIIQCDTVIQEDYKITCKEEFDNYIKHMTLKGMGGTDFRPVFEYVDKLIYQKEFRNLKGMIYFTDGYGNFPARQPKYQTAVIYIDDEYNNPDVPVWAIKLVLKSDEI